jgi:ribonuclease MRP protein subunit RMP1
MLTEAEIRALSNLVADNQYAALGLVLMGALASVKRAIRPLGREKVNIEGSSDGPNEQKILQDSEVVTDLGEVVKREEIEKFVETSSGARRDEEGGEGRLEVKKAKKKRKIEGRKEQKISEEASKEVNTAKRPKKKRKKGDAFDDLFSSLV